MVTAGVIGNVFCGGPVPKKGLLGPLRFGAQVVPPLVADGVMRVVCGLVNGRPVAFTCDDEAVRVWDMGDHRQVGELYPISIPGRYPILTWAWDRFFQVGSAP
jgi:hypothetical protein